MSYEYNPKSNVVFGDVDLSDYNAYAVYCNIFDRPERDISVVSVPGRNGDLIFDNGRYKNVDRTYQIHVVGVENVHNLIRDLTSTIGYQRLEDEYDPNVYMMARLKTKPNVRKFVGNAVLLTVTFDRMPQRWDKDEKIAESKSSMYVLFDDGSLSRYHAKYTYVQSNSYEELSALFKLHGQINYDSGSTYKSLSFFIFIRDTKAEERSSGREVYLRDFFQHTSYIDVPNKDTFSMSLFYSNESESAGVKQFNVVIDSENQVVYDEDTKENLNDGIREFVKFPKVFPGDNHIYVLSTDAGWTEDATSLISYEISARKWTI